jgi:hypothetical protein
MKSFRKPLTLALPLILAAAAQADMTFSNVTVDGASIVEQGMLGDNGYTIKFDAVQSKVTGNGKSKTITLGYVVTTTELITGFTFSPLGSVSRGDVNVALDHSGTGDSFAWSSTTSSVSSLAQKPSESLAASHTYNVLATINLSTLNTTPTNRFGIASLSQFNISYQTTAAPVPEPATCLVVAAGLAAIARRRKKGSPQL